MHLYQPFSACCLLPKGNHSHAYYNRAGRSHLSGGKIRSTI